MNMLINTSATMSSREIAELTGKDHRHVLADIRKMFEELGETSAGFSADLPDAYGRPQPAFNLPKRETLILVSGYSVTMRARIIDRWQELEAQPTTMSHSKPTPRHNQHAHRMLQRSAAYLLAQACQIGPQRTKSLWLIPAQPHHTKKAQRGSGTSHA